MSDTALSAKRSPYNDTKTAPTFESSFDKLADQNWQNIQLDATLKGALQHTLRERLSVEAKKDDKLTLFDKAASAAEWILHNKVASQADKELLDEKLNELYAFCESVYNNAAIPKSLTTRQFINASGLVMSPKDCMTTVRDTFRMSSFIRGTHQAIVELLNNSNKPINITYPACGPFAPLLLPLLCYYQTCQRVPAAQLSITFVDIQPGAVLSLEALVNEMGVQDYVAAIVCDDATQYTPTEAPDLVLLEAMQHGFTREAHFSIARHYASLLSERGVMVPQNISVGAMLNVAQREYVDQWRAKPSLVDSQVRAAFTSMRTDLGEIFNLNLASILQTHIVDKQDDTELLECGEAYIPSLEFDENAQVLMIYARVNTYGDEWLDEYQSGITHPLPDMQVCINFTPKDSRPGDLLVQSGDTLKFYYCLNGLPGFLAVKK